MTKENALPIKVSKKGKDFLKQMQINRIKLDLDPLTYSQCLEKLALYFKKDNNKYLEMLKQEEENVRRS